MSVIRTLSGSKRILSKPQSTSSIYGAQFLAPSFGFYAGNSSEAT